MCGLVGVAGAIETKHEKVFKDLLAFDVVRGPHSTGIAAINRKGECTVVKNTMLPHHMFEWKPFTDVMRSFHSALIGHNRWATVGKVNVVNAHPFEFENVVGAHNGTLRAQHLLDDHAKFEVDSENIYHHMDKHGIDNTYEKLNGAVALTWWDFENDSLCMIRNHERPLYYCYSENKKVVMWASEEWMLWGASVRNDVKITKPVELPVHTLYEFEIDMSVSVANAQEVVLNKRPLPQYKPPVGTSGRNATAGAGKWNSTTRIGQRCSVTIETIKQDAAGPYMVCKGKYQQDVTVHIRPNKDNYFLFGYFGNKDIYLTVVLGALRAGAQGKPSYFIVTRFDDIIINKLNGNISVSYKAIHETDKIIPKAFLGNLEKKQEETEEEEETRLGPNQRLYTKSEFERKFSSCCYCGSPVSFEDDVSFLGENDVICETCIDDTNAQGELGHYGQIITVN